MIDNYTGQIHQGHAIDVMESMPENSVHCVVTSPPYWAQRDYGEGVEAQFGGDPECDHQWASEQLGARGGTNTDDNPPDVAADEKVQESRLRNGGVESDRCVECGAWVGQLGLEPSADQYVQNLVAVGEAIMRVLRPDGNWWLNLGDTYAGSWGAQSKGDRANGRDADAYPGVSPASAADLPRKSKMLLPHRVAIALQDAGWVVRQDVVWNKPNSTPNPVKDRVTTTKEYVFHLSPNPDYWFDLDAIREPYAEATIERCNRADNTTREHVVDDHTFDPDQATHPNGKNPGDVWEISVGNFPDAHFAVFPESIPHRPIKSSCPRRVCAECGMPYERDVEKIPAWEQDRDEIDRPQLQEALERFDQSDLTTEHLEAARALGFSDAACGQEQVGAGNNADKVERMAREAKDVLGGYFREMCMTKNRATGWTKACACRTAETASGVVLDPFAGVGTTCRVAKDLGRRFVGIELSEEYRAMAQERVGVTVENPEHLRENDTALSAYGGGGDAE